MAVVSDPNFRRLRVLHLVGADYHSAPNPLLLPLLTRGNRQRIESQVVHFVPGATQFAVVRQSGVPVHEVALSSARFSPSAYFELKKIVKQFNPDAIHAWGAAAQIAASLVARGGKSPTPVVWSIARTTPLTAKAGLMDKTVFKFNKKYAKRCKRIVYASAAAGSQHRRAGLPEELGMVIAPGVDADRYKPDPAVRQRVREQLELPKDAILIGMYAPFQPEFDHATFLKAIGELTRVNPNLYCVLAGRAMVRGNAPLMAMVGGGTLGTRTRVIGEWSDLGALFNACDVVCSSATNDATRLMLAIAMLCGVLCAGTGMGAQGEVIGNFGAAVEPGSPDAMTRGIRRILDMPEERKAFMVQAARKHILQNFNMARSIEKYHELYIELVTGVAPKPAPLPEEPTMASQPAPVAPAPKPAPTKAEAKPEEVKPVATPKVETPAIAAVQEPENAKQAPPTPVQVEAKPAPERMIDKPFDIESAAEMSNKVEHVAEDNVIEWSAAEAELIDAVMVESQPAPVAVAKPVKATPEPVQRGARQFELGFVESSAPESAPAQKKDAAA